jgi:hypothetical protein
MSEQTTTIKQVGGYCVVQREVAQCLRNHTQILGLYSFLLSLPDGWEFKKAWLQKETKIGKNKLTKMLKFLADHNLVKTIQKKVNGKFAEFDMEVYDGKDFKPLELSPLFKTPCHRNRGTETVATEIDHKILDIEITKNNIKNSCSSGDEPFDNDNSFDRFWEAYPRKEAKKDAMKAWLKIKREYYEQIINDISMRKDKNWKNRSKQYIPLPSSYLNGQRWNDELRTEKEPIHASKRETQGEKCWRISQESLQRDLERERSQSTETAYQLDYNPLSTFSRNME